MDLFFENLESVVDMVTYRLFLCGWERGAVNKTLRPFFYTGRGNVLLMYYKHGHLGGKISFAIIDTTVFVTETEY